MVVPLVGRSVAAVAGVLLVLTAGVSVIGTLIVPRPVSSWLTRWVDRIVNEAFRLATRANADTGGGTGCSPGRRRRSCSRSWPPGWGSPSSGTRCCCGRSPPAA